MCLSVIKFGHMLVYFVIFIIGMKWNGGKGMNSLYNGEKDVGLP